MERIYKRRDKRRYKRKNKRYRSNRNDSKIKEMIIYHIKENIAIYVIFLSIFAFGLIAGSFFVNNISNDGKTEITNYLSSYINILKENTLNDIELVKISIKDNVLTGVILWFLGSTVIGIILCFLLIGFKGFCLGYTISAIVASFGIPKGILFIVSSLLLQNIIYIPCLISLGVSGAKFCKCILRDFKKINVKEELLKHTIFSSAITVFLILSSIIEIFVSKKLLNFLIKYF